MIQAATARLTKEQIVATIRLHEQARIAQLLTDDRGAWWALPFRGTTWREVWESRWHVLSYVGGAMFWVLVGLWLTGCAPKPQIPLDGKHAYPGFSEADKCVKGYAIHDSTLKYALADSFHDCTCFVEKACSEFGKEVTEAKL